MKKFSTETLKEIETLKRGPRGALVARIDALAKRLAGSGG